MSGSTRTSANLDVRRRRILFRAWHRGTREMDLLMGQFVDAEIETLTEHDLDELERLIEVPDRDVFGWVTGENDTPDNYRSGVLERLRAFHSHSGPVHL